MLQRLANKIILLITVAITAVFVYNYCLFDSAKHSGTMCFYGDALGYYFYLPSAFIYHTLKSPDKLPTDKGIAPGIQTYARELSEHKTDKGNTIIQYTYGIAFMESPFFFIAHAYEKIRGHQANGYSIAYIYMIKIGTLIYAILGLLLVYIILTKYFNPTQSLLGTTIIFLGTNLFWFSLFQAGMSHVPLFFLYALLIWLNIKVHEKPGILLFLASGFVAGLITIIRPTDILCLFIPLLYNFYNRETIRKKIALIKENLPGVFLFAAAFIIPIIPQLLYWKAISGHFLFYSYEKQSFNWSHPKIIEGLFYGANGWLMYSPIMIFSVIGMFLYKSIKKWAWVIWIVFPLYVYVIYSWYCYNYINGLGSRPMIHLYPLLAITLTAFIKVISRSGSFIKIFFGAIFSFCIALNINYSVQEAKGILWSESSTLLYNTHILFKTHLDYNDLVTLDIEELQPDTARIQKVAGITCASNEDTALSHPVSGSILGNNYHFHMANNEYQDLFVAKYDKAKFKDAKWLKCSGRYMYPDYPADWKRHVIVFEIPNKVWKGCQIENKIGGWQNEDEMTVRYAKPQTWGNVYFFVKIPKNIADGDLIKVFIWDMASRQLYIDDVCLEAYK